MYPEDTEIALLRWIYGASFGRSLSNKLHVHGQPHSKSNLLNKNFIASLTPTPKDNYAGHISRKHIEYRVANSDHGPTIENYKPWKMSAQNLHVIVIGAGIGSCPPCSVAKVQVVILTICRLVT